MNIATLVLPLTIVLLGKSKTIVKLCNKISPIVANRQHLRHFLTYEQINTLYFSYIQPHINYGLTIWGHCANRLILKVQRFQNRCARIVTQKFDYEIRSNTILRELRWLNISQRRDYLTCILVFKCLNGLAPSYLSDLLTARSTIHLEAHDKHQPIYFIFHLLEQIIFRDLFKYMDQNYGIPFLHMFLKLTQYKNLNTCAEITY